MSMTSSVQCSMDRRPVSLEHPLLLYRVPPPSTQPCQCPEWASWVRRRSFRVEQVPTRFDGSDSLPAVDPPHVIRKPAGQHLDDLIRSVERRKQQPHSGNEEKQPQSRNHRIVDHLERCPPWSHTRRPRPCNWSAGDSLIAQSSLSWPHAAVSSAAWISGTANPSKA